MIKKTMNNADGPGREKKYVQRAKKRLGQHFLSDGNLIAKIIRAAGVRPGEVVVEIGPGPGYLTEALLRAGAVVTAVELDRELCNFLKDKFSGEKGFTLIEGDALKLDFPALSRKAGGRLKVVSNPPYNITGPLLFKVLEERVVFSGITLMLQKEVAERIVSGPGTKDYGILSVLLQVYFDVKPCFRVSRNLFRPRPRVDSMVVALTPLEGPSVEVEDEQFFRAMVEAAFGKRRKTLLNALGCLGVAKEALKKAIEGAGVEPGARAETLTLKDFSRLEEALLKIM